MLKKHVFFFQVYNLKTLHRGYNR